MNPYPLDWYHKVLALLIPGLAFIIGICTVGTQRGREWLKWFGLGIVANIAFVIAVT